MTTDRRATAPALGLVLALAAPFVTACVDDPPDPEAGSATLSSVAATGAPGSSAASTTMVVAPLLDEDGELPDALDDLLDGLEDQYESRGVKDIRFDGGRVVVRIGDDVPLTSAAAPCAAVRAAGFADVVVRIDHRIVGCP